MKLTRFGKSSVSFKSVNRIQVLIFSLFLLLTLTSYRAAYKPIGRVEVIFHVIHSDRTYRGLEAGANQNDNLPTEVLLKELNDLKQDFLKQNPDTSQVHNSFKRLIGNPEIEFVIADTVLQKGEHPGIKRIFDESNRSKLYKRDPVIKPSRYLNVYIGHIGTSYTPSDESWEEPLTDAVYLDFQWVGKRYRLLTHEVGHWMGLLHIFGGSGNGKGGHCKGQYADDGINDTPMQSDPTDSECDHCPPVVSDQVCNAGSVGNYNNFMDYSGCRKMFTIEQCKKMQQVLLKNRADLRSR